MGTSEAKVMKEARGEISFGSLAHFKADSTSPKQSTLNGDTTSTSTDSITAPIDTNKVQTATFIKSGIDPEKTTLYPYASLQQALKGNVAGIYVQEPSGEPGTEMSMFIRGTAIPYISHQDVYNAQPTVILDGVPLIMDHPFAFDVQQYDYNRLGPATNLLSAIDPNNIASIKVLKDFGDAAIYGPRAANGGVILITTKAPVIGGRKIAVNSYVGFVQRPHIFTTNARFENNFRKPFYDRYAGLNDVLNYPLYLRDSTNPAYYGPSNWTDLYYQNKVIRGIDASLSSGTQRANFRFSLGNQQTKNPGDNTKMDRYNAMFELNMVPLTGLTLSSMITATRLERVRNTSLRDRFATVEYLPDLISPLPSNKSAYGMFLQQQDKSIDNNKSNVITGYFKINLKFSDDWHFVSNFGFNYNEGLRDVFYPTTLMETVNYASNYFGYNQRIMFNNTLSWHHNWDKIHDFTVEAGEVFEADFNRYNYSYAFNGPNDLIKINELNSNPGDSASYLSEKAFPRELTYMFLDKEHHRLLSFFGHATYHYKDALDLSVLIRADGSSSAQPDNWWFVSPTFSASWNIKNSLLKDNDALSLLKLHASWGRVGRLMTDDRFGEGPQYVSDMSFNNNPVKFSYDAFPGLSRPYSYGYIGYGIKWPYTDQLDLGADIGVLQQRLNLSIDVYNKIDHNMLLKVPEAQEYGYSGVYRNGMEVRNRGIDVSFQADVLPKSSKLRWYPAFNFNYNQNDLMALPDGLQQLIIGSGTSARMLKVGHAIDQYWVLQNDGIYNREKDIPLNPKTQQKMTYKGTPLQAGDPIWKDLNGDYTIDDEDKVMKGHYLPKISGGFSSDFVYQNFTLSLSFYYVTGREVLNQDVANHLDFVNREGNISMDAIKEVTFWSKTEDYSRYPMYNPWSKVQPYQIDQDLFLENGSF
ncbi:MAG TPA: SusC/RagA family TonB-linked outer membrane protein, partial [Chitinophagaceae bacterium]|nr:SusC/RagA family TonB-linked outer membrane protein [Chitinophagaceae bacterium]